jgi:TPR repeat protein
MTRWFVAVAFAVAMVPRDAAAIPRSDCAKGTAWDIAAGACVKKKVAPRASAQERFEKASDDIEGRGKAPDPKRGLAALEQTCGEKHGPSCRLLGFLYVRGRAPATKDDRKAADYFAKGCSVNDLESCVDVGDLAVRTGDYAKARIAFQHGCELGSGVACVRDGDLLDRGLGGAKDTATALPLFKKALDKLTPQCPTTGFSDGAACAWLGWIYEHGKGASKDLGKALAAFKSGCNAGHGEACMSLGRALDEGFGGVKDTTGANTAYDRACTDFDNADACQKIGERLGMAKQDLPRAFKLAERGCQLDPKYCGTLAEFYRLGFGITTGKDQIKATANYKKACDNGGLGWCQNYGERVAEGIGIAKDRDAAIAALEKACLGSYMGSCGPGARFLIDKEEHARAKTLAVKGCADDDGDSCYRLGWLYEAGKGGVEKSAEEAVKQYEVSCKLDSPIGCNGLANMYAAGTGIAKDPAKALELYKKACEGNAKELFTESCTKWGKMVATGDGVAKDMKSALKAYLRACEYRREDSCRYVPGINAEAGGKREDIIKTLDDACQAGFEEACHAYADVHTMSSGESDRRIAYETFEKSCGRKSELACIRQADLLANGRGVTKNLEKAEQLYKTTCEAGFLYACTGLGSLYLASKKSDQAITYYKRACEGGHSDACNGIGFMYYTSNGVRWDITQAVGYFVKSCELGSLGGCGNVGEMYRYGIGVKLDHKKAFEHYEKSCSPPTIDSGCAGLGHYLLTGEGGMAIDLKRAELVLRTSCEAEYSSPSACQELAQVIEQNKGSLADVARLRNKAFTRATELAAENPSYTWLLGEYYRDGMATPKDPVKATELFVKGCEGFDPMSCIAAGKALKATGKSADADRARVYLERACAAGIEDGCSGLKAKGPTPVGGGKGCCGGEVAPGAEAGAIVLLFVLAGRRRRRK